jgi:hypothetical protein
MLDKFKLNYKMTYEDRNNIFVLISLLHVNGFINDKSIAALFNLLRKGKLVRRVETYHSKINDRWYNDESINDVYEDILLDMINPKSAKVKLKRERINKLRALNGLEPKKYKTYLDFDETMKYLNLYLNKNRNYCIDHLYHEFIKPNINCYDYKKNICEMFSHDFKDIENNYSNYNDYEYCCEYCCGDYDSWLESVRERNSDIKYQRVKEDIAKLISKFLNTKREKFKNSYKEFVL